MAALPASIFLKSSAKDKYLRYNKGDGVTSSLGFTQDENETVDIQYVKFEVEMARAGKDLVHIKTCYNNKYLVRMSSDSKQIVAEAHEAEEDQSKWSCTLFRPVLMDAAESPLKVQLVQLSKLEENYACVSKADEAVNGFELVDAASLDPDVYEDVLTVYDATAAVTLPEYVVFMTSYECYASILVAYPEILVSYPVSSIVKGRTHRITPFPLKLTVAIQNTSSNKFWSCTDPVFADFKAYVLANRSDVQSSNKDAMFKPILLTSSTIALRSVATSLLVKEDEEADESYRADRLCASATTVVVGGRFQLEEPVLSRKLTGITFDLDNSRIYDVGSVEKYKDVFSNYSDVDQHMSLNVSFTKSTTMSMKDTISVSLGITATFTFGLPFVEDAQIQISEEISGSFEWGVEQTQEETIQKGYEITIPPWTKLTFTAIMARGLCDVPFTCEVTDAMSDGTPRTYTKEGVFTGANEYHADAKTETQPLPRPVRGLGDAQPSN